MEERRPECLAPLTSALPTHSPKLKSHLKTMSMYPISKSGGSWKGLPQGLRGGNETRTGVLCVHRCRPRLPAGPLDSDTLCVSVDQCRPAQGQSRQQLATQVAGRVPTAESTGWPGWGPASSPTCCDLKHLFPAAALSSRPER